MARPNLQDDEEQAPGARAVLRVLGVLCELAAHPAGMPLVDLAERLDVPKASLHRILRTLRQAGYLTLAEGVFRLGPEARGLARMIGEACPPLPFPDCLRPALDWLAVETGETVMLGLPDEALDDIGYAVVIESAHPIRFGVAAGDRRPLYCAASGQAVLAFLPEAARRAYLARTDFVAFTPLTLDGARLEAAWASIRREGYACDVGGRVEGASGVASPVFDADGRVCAAISVAGPVDRIAASLAHMGDRCRRAGERASRILGFRGDYPVLA